MRYFLRSLGLLRLSAGYVSIPADSSLNSEFYDNLGIVLESEIPGCEAKFSLCTRGSSNLTETINCIEGLKPDCVSRIEYSRESWGCTDSEMMLLYRSNNNHVFNTSALGTDVCYIYPIGEFPFNLDQGTRVSLVADSLSGESYTFPTFALPQEQSRDSRFTDDPLCKVGDSPSAVTSFAFSKDLKLSLDLQMERSAQTKKYLTIHFNKTADLDRNGTDATDSRGELRICGKAQTFKINLANNDTASTTQAPSQRNTPITQEIPLNAD